MLKSRHLHIAETRTNKPKNGVKRAQPAESSAVARFGGCVFFGKLRKKLFKMQIFSYKFEKSVTKSAVVGFRFMLKFVTARLVFFSRRFASHKFVRDSAEYEQARPLLSLLRTASGFGRIFKDRFNFFEVALWVRSRLPHILLARKLAAGNAGFREASSKQLNSFGVFSADRN